MNKFTYFLIIFCVLLHKADACQLSIPISYVPTFLNPPVSGHYEKCDSKPNEQCLCVDTIDPWVSELADNEVIDYVQKNDEISCEDEADCDSKFESHSCREFYTKVKNYDQKQVYCTKEVMKIDGKKLVVSEAKKAQRDAQKLAEKIAMEADEQRKKDAKEALKAVDIDGATTIAKLRDIVKKLIEANK